MEIVRTARHRWAKVARWNIPADDAIVAFEQCAIEGDDRCGISEIDRLACQRVLLKKPVQLRATLHKPVKVISHPMRVARVQLTRGVIRFFGGLLQRRADFLKPNPPETTM